MEEKEIRKGIERLSEKDNLYLSTSEFGRSQFVDKIYELQQQIKELQDRIDKAIKYIKNIKHLICTSDTYIKIDEVHFIEVGQELDKLLIIAVFYFKTITLYHHLSM